MEFQVRYLTWFLFFSVIDGLKWFWMTILHKNIQLILEFLKAPFLILHFSCYTLMTFVMVLSVILLSMLMILLSILSVIRHLICGNNLNWLLNLNLIYETLDWSKKWLVDFNAGKTQLVSFYRSNSNGSIYVKMDESEGLGLSFFLLRLLCICINLPFVHVWSTVATSGLVPLVATWNC